MGWFFNKDNKSSSQNNPQEQKENQSEFFNIKSTSYSKKRYCKNDPQDDQYMICKTVIKDNNGTSEKEERILKNKSSGNRSSESTQFSFSSSFGSPFNNKQEEEEKAFDKFNSFFIQPSFFDMHNNYLPQAPQNQEIQSYTSSYSKSRSCHSDPQNPEYLICKSKVFDENGTKEYEERVKRSDQPMVPFFRGELQNFGNEVDQQIHNLVKDINKGFNLMMPFISPFIGLINEIERLDQNQGLPNNGYNLNHQQNYPRFVPPEQRFNEHAEYKNKKDTNVYDL